jgi:hypothetical protein
VCIRYCLSPMVHRLLLPGNLLDANQRWANRIRLKIKKARGEGQKF